MDGFVSFCCFFQWWTVRPLVCVEVIEMNLFFLSLLLSVVFIMELLIFCFYWSHRSMISNQYTRVENLIVVTIYLQLIQNRYMFRSFTVLQCSHQHCVQPVASDVEVVGYL